MTTPKEKIAKLERLLARVKERAEAPRPAATAAIAQAPVPAASPVASAEPHREERAPSLPAPAPLLAKEPSLPPPPAKEPSLAPPPVQAKEPSLAPPPPAKEPSLAPPPVPAIGEVENDVTEVAPPPIAARLSEPPATQAEPARASVPPEAGWSEPPPAPDADEAPEISTSEEYVDDDLGDVEVSSEVVELDVDIDEAEDVGHAASPGEPAQSGAQPVADHAANEAAAPQAELEVVEESAKEASIPPEPEPEPEPAAPPPPANEVVEPAPSSSPRPIVNEPLAAEESGPRHTPPPESGKQVAAASTSVKPEPGSEPPPASAEGHTMIGGWTRAGEAAPTGGPVGRVPPPPPPPPADLAPPPPPPPPPPADVVVVAPPPPPPPPPPPEEPAMELEEVREPEPEAEVPFGAISTNPVLPADAKVAVVEGAIPTHPGTTFGDLLDASLSLSL